MGKVALAAKITHVPSMYLSELDGPRKGTRQDAIDGPKEIGRRCRELGVDTIVVFDTHWLVNANYHVNCAPHFKGLYTSNELPHFISNLGYEFPGNPALGQLLAKVANEMGFAASIKVSRVGLDALRPSADGLSDDTAGDRTPSGGPTSTVVLSPRCTELDGRHA